jgi:hypothetical protein
VQYKRRLEQFRQPLRSPQDWKALQDATAHITHTDANGTIGKS